MNASANRRFVGWTTAVVASGAVPWMVGQYLGFDRGGGCANAFGAIGKMAGTLLLLTAGLSPMCILPALVGYVVAVHRARGGHPETLIPPASMSAYKLLCGAIVITVTWETLLFFLYRTVSPSAAGIAFVAGMAGLLLMVAFFVWSIIVGLRLTRIGKAIGQADAVCVHCGFVVAHDWQYGCPVCGADIYPTSRSISVAAESRSVPAAD